MESDVVNPLSVSVVILLMAYSVLLDSVVCVSSDSVDGLQCFARQCCLCRQ